MANKKITQLDALTSAAAAEGDVLPIVDLDTDQTKKIQLGDLKSGSFAGTSTGLTGVPSIIVNGLTTNGENFLTNVSAGGVPSTNQILTRDASTGQIYITGSYANAGGGGSGGSAFPFTGSAEITGSLKMIGPITSSGDISGSSAVQANRVFADTYVSSPLFQNEGGVQLEGPAGTVGITGSNGIGIKTNDDTSGNISINSAKNFINTVAGAYHLIASGGIRITGSGGGIHPIELDAGLEDGVFVRGGNAGINLISATNTIINSTGNVEISGSGARGVRISSSKFSLQGNQTSEIKMNDNANLDIFGSPLGDMSIQPGFARTLNITGEAANVNVNAANTNIVDSSGGSMFHLSASGIHLNNENQFFQIISNLPTTEPTISGQLWASGSGYGSASGSKYIMIKQ